MKLDAHTTRPFRGSDAVAAGDVTWRRLAGPAFRPLLPDVHVGAKAEIDTATWVRAVSLWSHGTGVVAGPLAALAWGGECPWSDRELILPTSRHAVSIGEVRVRRDRLLPDEVGRRFGVPVTTPARTAFDLARRGTLADAVAAVDVLARTCHVTSDHLCAMIAAHPGARGSAQARQVAGLMDGRSGSIPESHLRLVFVLRGVRAPVPQYEVRAGGTTRFLDLGWPDVPPGRRKVGCEYDGPEHRSITGHNRDLLREADLDDEDWEIIHVGAVMVYEEKRADQLAERVRRLID